MLLVSEQVLFSRADAVMASGPTPAGRGASGIKCSKFFVLIAQLKTSYSRLNYWR